MAYCTKCGNQLNDEALFCDKCGTAVVKNEKTDINTNEVLDGEATDVENVDKTYDVCESDGNTKNCKSKKLAIIIGACVVVIAIAITSVFLFMHFSKSEETVATDDTTKVEETTEEKEEEKPNKELTEAEILRDEYFKNFETVSASSETLVRNPNIFKGVCVWVCGKVANTLKSENDSNYSIQIDEGYASGEISGTVIQGTYKKTDKRKIKGDTIQGYGKFDGVDLFYYTDNSGSINAGVIKDFQFVEWAGKYNMENIKTIISTVFGRDDIDVRAEEGSEGDNNYLFSIVGTNGVTTKWFFSEIGGYKNLVSFDNGDHWCSVKFDNDYKHFYAIEYREDGVLVVKYCDLEGNTVWSRSFECKYDEDNYTYNNNIIVSTEKTTYMPINGSLYILKTSDGTDKKKPVLLNGCKEILRYKDSLIAYGKSDEIFGIDFNGNVLWSNATKFKDYYIAEIYIIDDEILARYLDSSYKEKLYRRINAETGETVNELIIGN